MRLFWEIGFKDQATNRSPSQNTDGWVPLAKGGEYRPFHDDIHLLVDWRKNGQDLKQFIVSQYPYLNGNWGWVIKNSDHYFKPGLTWSYRTTSAFCLKVLPGGCVFSDGGWAMFPVARRNTGALLAVYNSALGRYFMEVPLGQGDTSASGTAARNYSSEPVCAVPFVNIDESVVDPLVQQLVDFQRSEDLHSETARLFTKIDHRPECFTITERTYKCMTDYWRNCLRSLQASKAIQEKLESASGLVSVPQGVETGRMNQSCEQYPTPAISPVSSGP